MASEEFTPRDLGLLLGSNWAELEEPADVKRLAAGVVSDDERETILEAGMRERLEEFEDPGKAEEEFWQGFVHGIRASAFVQEVGRAARMN
jgi:hypothetical protein